MQRERNSYRQGWRNDDPYFPDIKEYCESLSGTGRRRTERGAELLEPTVDTVTYDDGLSEEVYGYDVPVPELEKEFDLALIGTKGKWYDHKVSVANPEKTE